MPENQDLDPDDDIEVVPTGIYDDEAGQDVADAAQDEAAPDVTRQAPPPPPTPRHPG